MAIKFKDLSFWMKVGVIGGLLYLADLLITFLVGFFVGVASI